MDGTHRGWWKTLLPRSRHEIAAEVDTWGARRTARITAGEPPSSSEEESLDEEDVALEEEEE